MVSSQDSLYTYGKIDFDAPQSLPQMYADASRDQATLPGAGRTPEDTQASLHDHHLTAHLTSFKTGLTMTQGARSRRFFSET